MKITEKYILKELVPVYTLGNIFFIFLLLLDKIVDLSELVLSKSVPFFFIVELIIAYLPSFLIITLPTSALLSSLIVYGRLSDDSELIAMKSLSAKKFSLYFPALSLGIISFVFAIVISLYLMPKGNDFAIKKLLDISKFVSINDFKENELYTEIPGFVLFTENKLDKNRFKNLIIINKKENIIINAKDGEILNSAEGSLIFDLHNGVLVRVGKETPSKVEFKNFAVNIPVSSFKNIKVRDERVMDIKSLVKNLKKDKIYQFELSKRFSIPFASIIMALFGAVLGSFFHRGGKAFGLTLSIVIVLIYNTILIFSQNMLYVINPYVSAWIANIIFSFMLIYFYRRV